jgi:hypothetical protein
MFSKSFRVPKPHPFMFSGAQRRPFSFCGAQRRPFSLSTSFCATQPRQRRSRLASG